MDSNKQKMTCPKCKNKLQVEKKKFYFVKCIKCRCEAVAIELDKLHLGGWRYVD